MDVLNVGSGTLVSLLGALVCLAGVLFIFMVGGTVGIPVTAAGIAVVALGVIAARWHQTGT
ncbi:MAG: hypothetical protein J2P45_09530 [Candidatus Dormibacteraeota bacterium]|nr:hypothetical protein [Candidatus Dormibacteraeota bacterium]